MALTWVRIGNLKGPKGDVGTWYQRALTTADNLDTIANGSYTVWTGDVATALGLPEVSQGEVRSVRWGAAGGIQWYKTRSWPVKEYHRAQLSGGWDVWTRSDIGALETLEGDPLAPAGGSGFKTVPLALTFGNGGSTTGVLAGSMRQVLSYTAPILRWRWAMRDGNPRYGTSYANAINLTGMWLNGVRVMNASVATGIETFYSPWVQGSPNGTMEIGYTSAQAPRTIIGGGGFSSSAASAGTGAGYSNTTTQPFEQWLEVETLASTPVLGWLDSSTGAGVGATNPTNDNPLSMYCRQIKALPIHYSHSGDTMAASLDPKAYKWNRWEGLAKADGLFFGLGSNDWAAGTSLAELQSLSGEVLAIAVARLTPNIYARTIAPRSAATTGTTATRRSYNTWLRALPMSIRDLFEFGAKVSTDDATISPSMDSGDGVHLNTTGYTAAVTSLIRPVTANGNTLVSANGTRYELGVSITGEVTLTAV